MILKRDKSLRWFSGEKSGRRDEKAIKELEGKVDVMVGVMHMGLENENGIPGTGVQDIANACPISAIFAAHMHKLVKSCKWRNYYRTR